MSRTTATFLLTFFFFNDTATTEIYTLSLHDALPICDVARDVEGCLERQLPLSQQPMPERLSLDVRHDVVEQPVYFAGRKDRHDVGMAEVRGEVHFANEPLAQEAGGHLRVEHLDRHPAMGMLLHRQEHPGHAPGADLAFDIVTGRQALTQRVGHIEHARELSGPPLPGRSRDGPLADSVPRATISSWTAAVPCGGPPDPKNGRLGKEVGL